MERTDRPTVMRPTKDQVDGALQLLADDWEAVIDPMRKKAALVLAAEVRALRHDYAQAKALAETAHAARITDTATMSTWLRTANEDNRKLSFRLQNAEGTIARVERLCAQPHQKWIAQGDLRDVLRGKP